MNARIRRAAPGDLDALLALEAGFPGDRLSRRSLRRLLQVPSARVFVAVLDDAAGVPAVAGGAVLLLRRGSRRARLYSLAVDPAHRNRGIARALVHAVEHEAAACGCRELRLEVRADNEAARALYAALGYRPLQTLAAWYDDGSDGLRLARALD